MFYVGLSLTPYSLGAALELLELEFCKGNIPLTNNNLIFTCIYERFHLLSFSYWDELLKTLKTTHTYAVASHAWFSFFQGLNFLRVQNSHNLVGRFSRRSKLMCTFGKNKLKSNIVKLSNYVLR